MHKIKKNLEYIIFGFLGVAGLAFALIMFIGDKSPCRLSIVEESLRIDAGFYGDFLIPIDEAVITMVDQDVVVVSGREVYVKNNQNSAAGIAGIEEYPDYPVYLGIKNKTIPYILLVYAGNNYLVNESTVEKTESLYQQILTIKNN